MPIYGQKRLNAMTKQLLCLQKVYKAIRILYKTVQNQEKNFEKLNVKFRPIL